MTTQDIEKLTQETRNLKLLYVEDDTLARESTLEILEIFFEDITVAVDGKNGLELFENNSFDIVITDINMPKMNGIDMILNIKKINKNVIILILSAHDDIKYFSDTIGIEVQEYLFKPINIEQFMSLLAKSVSTFNLGK